MGTHAFIAARAEVGLRGGRREGGGRAVLCTCQAKAIAEEALRVKGLAGGTTVMSIWAGDADFVSWVVYHWSRPYRPTNEPSLPAHHSVPSPACKFQRPHQSVVPGPTCNVKGCAAWRKHDAEFTGCSPAGTRRRRHNGHTGAYTRWSMQPSRNVS